VSGGRQLGFSVHGIVFPAERQTDGRCCALNVHDGGGDESGVTPFVAFVARGGNSLRAADS
jgi:hypothetical protein